MPIYQIDIEKHALVGASTGEYWTNRYLVEAASLAAADTAAGLITSVERAIHTPAVGFSKRSVRDLDPTTDIYRTTPINNIGTFGGIPADILPAMLVVRVDLGVNVGRPSRKYYHLLVGEGSQSNGVWNPDLIDAVNSNMAILLAGEGGAGLCDPQGEPILSGAAAHTCTVHQFRRGTKRKLQPILP